MAYGQPSAVHETAYDPNDIHVGGYPLIDKQVTILSGAGVLTRGTLIGKIGVGAATAAGAAGVPAPAGATITAAPAAALGTKAGVHRFECIVGGAAAASKWRHTDPDGDVIGVATAGTAYAGGGLSGLTITDSGTDPSPGEAFDVTVTAAAGSGKYIKALAAAVDGSAAVADLAVLAEDVDATSADVSALAYSQGGFIHAKMTFGTGFTAAGLKAALANRGLFLFDSIPA